MSPSPKHPGQPTPLTINNILLFSRSNGFAHVPSM
jgi:hypothetical protein